LPSLRMWARTTWQAQW